MKNIKQKFKIVGILIFIVIILIIYFVYSSKQGKSITPQEPITISSSNPTNDSTGVSVFDPITITFNQKVDPLTITVDSEPSENWAVSQTSTNSVKITHNSYLRVSTVYKLRILQLGGAVGTLTFETAHEQNDPRLLQNLQSELDKDYPLVSNTPYETSSYRVVYSAPLTLEITLKSSMAKEVAISQVQSWVKSKGVDPSTHKYNITEP